MPQFHIDQVYKKDENYQYIVNFQNGYPTRKFEDAPCILFDSGDNKKKTIATQISDLLYSGTETEEDIGKTLILARDKISGKVRLIEVGSLSLKPSMKSDLESTQLLDTSNLELGRKFGSKKQKKILEQREKLKLNDQSVSEQMKNVSQNVSIDITDIKTLDETNPDIFYLPPCNKEAKSLTEVYPIEEMLSSDLYDKIYEEIQSVDLASILLNTIKSSLKTDHSKHIRVLALYCNALFSIATKNTKEISLRSYTPCVESPTLNTHLIENFFGLHNGRRTRSLHLKDKAICHGLVYLLLVSNYKFNFDSLCTELKTGFKILSTKLKMTGASLISIDNNQYAVLKLPLAKMPLKRGRKK